MLRATLASILAHRLRLAATALAVVVGVAFVTGTLILSDTLTATFDRLFAETTAGVDVVVQGPDDSADALTGRREPVPLTAADVVRGVDGVAVVEQEVQGFAQLIGDDGRAIGGQGPPTLGVGAPTAPEIQTPQVRDGRFPAVDGEVAVDAGTAAAAGIEVGDRIGLVVEGPVQQVDVVGIVGFGEVDNLAGATLVVLDPATAMARYGADGVDSLSVIGEAGVDPEALRADVDAALTAALGEPLAVRTQVEAAEQLSAEVGEGLGFFTTALLVFAGVALFVGAFLIANTFSIIVAQRTRELALLRAVGASRRQVMASVVGEALATGVLGSLAGVLAGIGLARGLYALLDAFDITLPQGDLVVTGGTVGVAAGLGTVLTVLVAAVPATRATRVPPVAALQAVAAPPPPRYGPARHLLGAVVFLGGVTGLAVALLREAGIGPVGAAAVVTLLGAALLAPLVTRPLLRVLGAPIAAGRGVQGQLASENALRNPRRTAATASALMVGLALVSFIAIMAASFTTTVEQTIAESFGGDLQIRAGGFFALQGDPGPELLDAVRAVDGVAVATPQQIAVATVDGPPGAAGLDGAEVFLSAYDAAVVDDVVAVDVVDGGEDGLLATGLAIGRDVADAEGVGVGDVLTVAAAGRDPVELEVGTVFEPNPVAGSWAVDAAALPDDALSFAAVLVDLADGADAAAARAELEGVLAAYPTLELQDLSDLQATITAQVNQLLGLITALLGLSVLVALVGIVNTLGLSVVERTRELGLLRAVGATRGQIRSMIRWEAVLIALLGAIFGLLVGVLFAWIVVTALAEDGGLELTIPAGQLVGGLIAAAVAGVLAAVLPARRAARTDVLRALEAT